MLGISDPWIWGVYVLCILSTVICVAYGISYWNAGSEREANEISEELTWEQEEEEMQEELGL